MTVSAVSGTGATTAATTSSTSGLSSVDSSTFLQLLVAQLKYQDPMNPAQGTEFLAQTAQFSMVEKLTSLAQQGTDSLTASRVVEATQMLGTTISYTDAKGNVASGLVTGTKLLATGPVLQVGSAEVALSAVLSVSSTTTPTPTTTTTATP